MCIRDRDHIVAMAELAAKRGAEKIYLHAFLDGRDTPPKSAQPSIELLDAAFARLGKGRIASLTGRYFAMDRDNRWDRVEQAYHLIVDGAGQFNAASAVEGLQAAYERGAVSYTHLACRLQVARPRLSSSQ